MDINKIVLSIEAGMAAYVNPALMALQTGAGCHRMSCK